MKSRLILLLLMLTCITSASAFDAKVKLIYYNLNPENRTATVTYRKIDKKQRTDYAGAVEIPERIKVKKVEYTVNCIGDSAFYGCHDIETIILPVTITSIGKSAFEDCSYLVEEQGDYYYKPIGYAFPTSLVSIGDRAFANSSVFREAKLPAKVKTIGKEAFMGSTITTVHLPESMEWVGMAAFENCENLMGVSTVNLESWCKINFETIYSNPLAAAHNLLINGKQLITNLEIPDGVSEILPNAFAGANFLSVRFPTSVMSIGSYAFYLCLSISELYIPSSVKVIDDGAFKYCSSLKNVYISNPDIEIGEENFEELQGKLIIAEGAAPPEHKCQPPVISYVDGKLCIESATPGAVCQYLIEQQNIDPSGSLSELIIQAVAIAEGYENSEVVKANLLEIITNNQ